jgi:xanthine/uracil permease
VSTPFFSWNWSYLVPPIVNRSVFILIGLYMMKSGAKKEKEKGKIQLPSQ